MTVVLTGLETVIIGLGGGGVAGLVNNLTGGLRDWLGRKGVDTQATKKAERDETQADAERNLKLRMQEDERRHQRLMRLDEAYADARRTLLPLAHQAKQWVDVEWGKVRGPDNDFVGNLVPDPILKSVAAVQEALDEVASLHPSKAVRAMANGISQSVSSAYNMWPDAEDDPSFESFATWSGECGGLIELMHEPPVPLTSTEIVTT